MDQVNDVIRWAKNPLGKNRGPLHSRKLRQQWRIRRVIALFVVFALSFSLSLVGFAGAVLYSSVKSEDIGTLYREAPPTDVNSGRAINILLVGLDDKTGENASVAGPDEGIRSDTNIIAHISADRKRIELLSIPRDSLVNVPDCALHDGRIIKERQNSMFNTAFSRVIDKGGSKVEAVACVMRTVTYNTGITLDGFVMADFTGFTKAVNALGGVPVCLAAPFEPDRHWVQLKLPAGRTELRGMDAIEFVRARKGVGDGSDLQRIVRQQYFLNNAFEKLMYGGALSNPKTLFNLAYSVTSSLTLSSNISSMSDLVGMAYSLRNIKREGISMMTVPNAPDKADPNRVDWTEHAAEVFKRIINDEPMSGSSAENMPSATAGSTELPVPTPGNTSIPGETQISGETSTPSPSVANGRTTKKRTSRDISQEAQNSSEKLPGKGVSKAAYDLGLRDCFPQNHTAPTATPTPTVTSSR